MKKRKSPVLLLSVLFILVGVAVVFAMNSGTVKPTVPTDKDEPALADAPGKATDAATLAAQAKSQTEKAAAEGHRGPSLQTPGQGAISIQVQKTARTYPKPKENQQGRIASQWYH